MSLPNFENYISVAEYFPRVYEDILEFIELGHGIDHIYSQALSTMQQNIKNTFISLANEEGIRNFENLFEIQVNSGETLEFRRERLLNRFSLTPPYTIAFLRSKLDAIIGVGLWEIDMNYATRTLYINTSVTDYHWLRELNITLTQIKPANLAVVFNPTLYETIYLNELIQYTELIYHYRLGTQWILGRDPFGTIEDPEVIKLPEARSLAPAILNAVASALASDIIVSARINGTVSITDIAKTSTGNSVTVSTTVAAGTVDEITLIELLDASSNVLTSSVVYITVINDVTIDQIINVEEGVN